ncbi:MAG: hypothetical protein N3D77_15695 [Geminicoccaceae bacterium]|nr:hypothetical protein [Geminicoccaceae bacterium]
MLAVQAQTGRAEPLELSEEELDLVTTGRSGSSIGTLDGADATAGLGTFPLEIASNGSVKGTVNVTGRGKDELGGLRVGAGFGGVLEQGKKGNGGSFASLSSTGIGYRLFGTWAFSSLAGEISASGALEGTSH